MMEMRKTLILIACSLLLVTCRREARESDQECDFSRKHIFASMIADMYPQQKDELLQRQYNYVVNFTNEVFRSENPPIPWTIMPPIYSKGCYDQATNDKWAGRGSNIAHKEVWDHFVRNRKSCGDVLIVFENDAMEGLPNNQAGRLAIQYAKRMTNDFLFLGSCYKKAHMHHSISGDAPYCLHAYAITVHGAKKMLEHFDACGALSDVQVANFCNSFLLNCTYTTESYDKPYVDNILRTQGMHLSGSFLYGEIFVQIKLEPRLSYKDGTVSGRSDRPRYIYVLVNETWRYVPNMSIFGKLNLEGKGSVTLTPWQFNKYPEGAELTDKEVDEKRLWELNP